MQGVCLKLFVSEVPRHVNRLLFLEQEKVLGICGGRTVRAIAEYGIAE